MLKVCENSAKTLTKRLYSKKIVLSNTSNHNEHFVFAPSVSEFLNFMYNF